MNLSGHSTFPVVLKKSQNRALISLKFRGHSLTALRLHHHLISNFRVIFSYFQCIRCQSFLEVFIVKMIFHVENCAERNLLKLTFRNFWVIVSLVKLLASTGSTQTTNRNSFVWG